MNIYNQLKELNIAIFRFFNETFGKSTFDHFMIFIDKFGGPHYFHYHFLLILIIASAMLYQRRHDKEALKELTISGFIAICTLFISILVGLVAIADLLKSYTEMNRPYCNLENIYVIPQITDKLSCSRAFPSGHLTFSVIMVTSFWLLFNRTFKMIAAGFIILVAISRMSSGAHYPIDLLGALVICLPLTLFIRTKVNLIVRKYEARLRAFEYIYKYIPAWLLK